MHTKQSIESEARPGGGLSQKARSTTSVPDNKPDKQEKNVKTQSCPPQQQQYARKSYRHGKNINQTSQSNEEAMYSYMNSLNENFYFSNHNHGYYVQSSDNGGYSNRKVKTFIYYFDQWLLNIVIIKLIKSI